MMLEGDLAFEVLERDREGESIVRVWFVVLAGWDGGTVCGGKDADTSELGVMLV